MEKKNSTVPDAVARIKQILRRCAIRFFLKMFHTEDLLVSSRFIEYNVAIFCCRCCGNNSEGYQAACFSVWQSSPYCLGKNLWWLDILIRGQDE